MPPSTLGLAVLDEYRAMLGDAEYREFFVESGNGSFGQHLICVLLSLLVGNGGAGGGGGTTLDAATITAAMNAAFAGTGASSLLLPPDRLQGNTVFTAVNDVLEFDVAASYGSKTWTANYNVDVLALPANESVSISVEVQEQDSLWTPKVKEGQPEIVTIDQLGSYNTTTSWSDEKVRLRCIAIPTGATVNVYGAVTRGGAGV